MICVARGRFCECEGRIQLHHAIPQQRIKREHKAVVAAYRRGGPKPWGLTRMLGDGRNLVPICKRHHELVEQRVIYLAGGDLPAGVWEFAADLDRLCGREGSDPFTALLERDLGRAA